MLPALPNGRLLAPGAPPMWLSQEPLVDASLWWSRLSLQQDLTGLRPLLLDQPDAARSPHPLTGVDGIDVEREFARLWQDFREIHLACATEPLCDDLPEGVSPPPVDPGPPYGSWPGLASATAPHPDPDAVARGAVFDLAPYLPRTPHVGLLPAERSADIPALLGWPGGGNDHVGVDMISAVLRSWEDRFGTRLIGFEGSAIHLSVASPPTTPEHSAHVALEHLLFCPDNVYQSPSRIFPGYAEEIRGEHIWTFSWD